VGHFTRQLEQGPAPRPSGCRYCTRCLEHRAPFGRGSGTGASARESGTRDTSLPHSNYMGEMAHDDDDSGELLDEGYICLRMKVLSDLRDSGRCQAEGSSVIGVVWNGRRHRQWLWRCKEGCYCGHVYQSQLGFPRFRLGCERLKKEKKN
jgi:hypothetical protein